MYVLNVKGMKCLILKKVKVQNFRMLKNFEIDLKNDLSLIVGKNNSGKTSVLTIMDRFLNFQSNRFTWDDFHLDYQKELYIFIVDYEGLLDEDFDYGGIKQNLFIEYDSKDNYSNIQNLMLDLDPENNIVVLEFYYSISNIQFKKLKEDIEINKVKNLVEFSKFMKKNSQKYYRFDVYARGFDAKKGGLTEEVSTSLHRNEVEKIIKLKSINANRDASNKHNDSSLSALSSKYYGHLKSNESDIINKFEKAIAETDKSLDGVYSEVFNQITKSVAQFGVDENETKVSVQSTLIDKELLAGNTTLFYEHEGLQLPESYNGLGYLNLIGIIFEIETIIADFSGKLEDQVADINIIFIEEPEAHTHPQLQYIFIENIKYLIEERRNSFNINLQVIMTTHSSHIVSNCDFDDIRYLKKSNNYSVAKNFEELKKRYYENDSEAVFKLVKQYLTLNKSELFFADKVIFIEGDTERILLPAMMKKIDLRDKESKLLSQNISIIEVGAYSHIFSKLISFLGIKALVITDIDAGKLGENNRVIKCDPNSKEVSHSTNTSLKAYFGTDNFRELTKLDLNRKQLRFSMKNKKDKYKNNLKGKICIAYQSIDNYNQASSFEDAFIELNLDFIKENKDKFIQGLKNKERLNNPSSSFQIAEDCINKKPAFAMEVLLLSDETFSNWEIPKYIEEGLKWIQE